MGLRSSLGGRALTIGHSGLMLDSSDGIVVADNAAALGIKTVILTGYAFRIPAVARHELWLIRPAELIDAVERCLGSASATQ
jgi:hypothetical protein